MRVDASLYKMNMQFKLRQWKRLNFLEQLVSSENSCARNSRYFLRDQFSFGEITGRFPRFASIVD